MKKDKEKRRSSLTFGEKMLFIAGILLCLVLITTAMMGGLFARYTAADVGGDRARVAAFNVNGEITDAITIVSDTNSKGEHTLTVNNDSEVAVRCSLSICFSEQIDDRIQVSLKTDDVTYPGILQSDGKTVQFQMTDDMAPGSSRTHTVFFEVSNWKYITEQATDPGTSVFFKNMAFTAYIDAVQID